MTEQVGTSAAQARHNPCVVTRPLCSNSSSGLGWGDHELHWTHADAKGSLGRELSRCSLAAGKQALLTWLELRWNRCQLVIIGYYLIQEQDARVFDESAGNGDALLLAAGQLNPSWSEL